MSGRAASLVAALAASLVLAGCGTATDDELEPQPTPTVTVTADPVQELPQQLDFASDLDFTEEVVWAEDTTLHVGSRTVDLAPLVPLQLVVLPTGVLVRTDTQVWFTAGRQAQGLPLPPVTSLGLSQAGDQVVLRLADRGDAVAYDLQGDRVDDQSVGRARGPRRVVAGPEGRSVPAGLDARGWVSPSVVYGLQGRAVASCVLARATPRCERLGRVPADTDPDDLVFGLHPAG